MQEPLSPEIIIEAALAIQNAQERDAYLRKACGGDLHLYKETQSLIDAYLADETFMTVTPEPLWNETKSENVGDEIGRYTLKKKIGEGGFANVFLALQSEPVNREVALKVVKPGMDSREIISRFETERQVLAFLDHPHIAKVFDAGTTQLGRPYFVMELVKGVPITNYCTENLLTVRARLELFTDLCAAVQHAHQKGIIHRDLKPSNILVSIIDDLPVVKVIDFGIAKAIGMNLTNHTIHTLHHRMLGTPQYMSPEQAENHALAVDTLTDVYSLGVILYELLTGTTPLDSKQLRAANYAEMQNLIRNQIPQKPSNLSHSNLPVRDIRGDLDWIVLKALEKDPGRRYKSAVALAEDVMRFLEHKPVEARSPSISYIMLRFTRRHRVPVIAGAALLFALLLGTIGTTFGMKRALAAKAELLQKNSELDQQKLALVDYKERLAGLLESNQNMLGEISKLNANKETLPTEFEEIRNENQQLLDKVKNEVANQERYTEQISRLQEINQQLDETLLLQKKELAEAKNQQQQFQQKFTGLLRSISVLNERTLKHDSFSNIFADRSADGIKQAHTIVKLTSAQRDESQTLGTLTLTSEQWREVRTKSPQSLKRITKILPFPLVENSKHQMDSYAVEISRERMAVVHPNAQSDSAESVREELFSQSIIMLRMNERGEFHLGGKLIPFPTLLTAIASAPQQAQRDEAGKLLHRKNHQGKALLTQQWLHVKLPTEAKSSDAVYQSRLTQLAAAADEVGLHHGIFAE